MFRKLIFAPRPQTPVKVISIGTTRSWPSDSPYPNHRIPYPNDRARRALLYAAVISALSVYTWVELKRYVQSLIK